MGFEPGGVLGNYVLQGGEIGKREEVGEGRGWRESDKYEGNLSN